MKPAGHIQPRVYNTNSVRKIVDEKLNKEKLLAQLSKVKPITVPPLTDETLRRLSKHK